MANDASKRIVLTGVTRGLGRAMAEGFAALGHTVIGCGRSAEAIDELRRTLGESHDFAVVDVARDDQVRAWAERVIGRFGPPDLLVNNAAVMTRRAPLWEIPADEIDAIFDVNVKGVAHVVRHFVPAMIARRSGVIVNFSSAWGRSTSAEVAPYCATKWAIEGLTRALSKELPEGLAAVPLNPGIIDTALLRVALGEAAGKYLDPRAWAEAAVPFVLQLGPKDNGKPLTVPGQ
jgi:NAD(P)-dependent dehydrogenase (short-subunit alcohol dehydrogenase family)